MLYTGRSLQELCGSQQKEPSEMQSSIMDVLGYWPRYLSDYSHSLCSREANLAVLMWKWRSNVNVSRSAHEISVLLFYAVCFERKRTSTSDMPRSR